jgi:hypothetical protein
MATIVTRAGKGSPLTHNEVDANFNNLNSDKIESNDTVASLTLTTVDINGGTIDDTVIGGSTPAAISGTTITATGDVDVADKITHTGDTDTSIRFPAADTVTVETAGSERMRIAASGNVGIGTSSPIYKLDVIGTADGSIVSRVGNLSTGAASQAIVQIGTGATPKRYVNLNTNYTSQYFQIFGASIATSYQDFDTQIFRSSSGTERMRIDASGNVTISGSLSKGSGSFKIDHPVKPETHHLVHSFIEGPQADNIYRGKVTLVDGTATVNLDEAGRMTEGTFIALNGNVQCFTTNEDGWTAVRGEVDGNTLTIEAQDATCTDTVSWLVIGERHDQHMIDANWTDEQGRIITEPAKGTAS